MGELAKWRKQRWVRIGTDGSIKGECGTSKNKKNPDRCLPLSKARRANNSLPIQRKQRYALKRNKCNHITLQVYSHYTTSVLSLH